ncbi:MAG: dephospho-CoA kinase [Spirochaetaceae bacterium]|jgi:dephospho-CoA kinase|nr:dephospho-CoA kinase [Spirochaetaceae bacterium]
MLIGLTGLSCAGKNYAGSLLEARGWRVLDVDKLGWTVLDNAHAEIARRWGHAVVHNDGRVDRKALGRIVFGNAAELAALEAIVHPRVDQHIETWLSAYPHSDAVINAALLHKTQVWPRLDAVIVIRAPFLLRLFRAKKRDKLPLYMIIRRFLNQKSFVRHFYETQFFEKKTDIYSIDNGIFRGNFERKLDKTLMCIHEVCERW